MSVSDKPRNRAFVTRPERLIGSKQMELLLPMLIVIATGIYKVQGVHCTTLSGAPGRCVNFHSCEELKTAHKDRREWLNLNDYLLLSNPRCIKTNHLARTPPKVVCCRNINASPKPSALSTCFTPNGQRGVCRNLYTCPSFTRVLYEPMTYKSLAYFERSRCGGAEEYSVCCNPSLSEMGYVETQPPRSIFSYQSNPAANYSPFYQSKPILASGSPYPSKSQRNVCAVTAHPPDPQSQCCGLQSSNDDRIIGGSATAIDQYPWLVLIEYMQYNEIELNCGGSLISGRYVLTASHCVTGPVLEVATPTSARLGEYDISHRGPDCVEAPGGGEDCTTGPLTIAIERIIPHELYEPWQGGNRKHDIALLRLSEPAPYTDFIRPICLPTSDWTLNPPNKFRLYASGWGLMDNTFNIRSNIKLEVDLPYVSRTECEPLYRSINITLTKEHICAGGETDKDSYNIIY